MTNEVYTVIFAAFASGLTASLAFTPCAISGAKSLGARDRLDERHSASGIKLRLGGAAIFAAFLVSVIIYSRLSPLSLSLIIGGFIVALAGAIDDIKGLKPFQKLIFITVAAAVPVCFGIRIEWITIFGKVIPFGIWSIPATIVWIIILTNAMNLIDGLDGLAGGISVISALTLIITALIMNEIPAAIIIACFCGACAGFLPYNFYPAKITLGDTGSLFIGFVFSVVSISGLFKTSTAVSYLIPAVLFSLPLSDVLLSVVRRKRNRTKITLADRKHLHYRLADSGLGTPKTVAILLSLTVINSIGAVFLALGYFAIGIVAVFITAIVVALLYLKIRK